ncbi:hypothetical protein VTK26DRAFT_4624 [Humicola hyalothermophila]
MTPRLLAALATISAPVLGHGGLANYTVGDTWYRGYDPSTPASEQLGQPWMVQRQWASIDPIFSVTDPHIACNNPGTAPPSYITIRAGDNLTAVYWYWLHPVGPMTVWLARCERRALADTTITPSTSTTTTGSGGPAHGNGTEEGEEEKDGDADCALVSPNRSRWFKIWEAGLLEGPSLAEGMLVPEGVSAVGQQRAGAVARPDPRQPAARAFYPECAHLDITGDGDVLPPEEYLVRFPGVYAEDDPSIMVDIYSEENMNTTEYIIPGGPIWDGFDI